MKHEPNPDVEQPDFDRVYSLLRDGDTKALSVLAEEYPAFPDGVDPSWNEDWIRVAIDYGALNSVAWMLEQGVGLDHIGDDGYFPLLSVMERDEDRHAVLKLLLDHGANVNLQGSNHTALHQAAMDEDLGAIRILLEYGADPLIETPIDLFATPLQKAIYRGLNASVLFLVESCKAWSPATREELDRRLQLETQGSWRDSNHKEAFESFRVEPYYHPIDRYGQIDQVWVVAEDGPWKFYFDDLVRTFFVGECKGARTPLINQSGKGLYPWGRLQEVVSKHLS